MDYRVLCALKLRARCAKSHGRIAMRPAQSIRGMTERAILQYGPLETAMIRLFVDSDRLEQQFRDVLASDGVVDTHGFGSVLEHDHAERTGDGDGVGLLGAQLLEADDAGLLVAEAFHPDIAAAAATAHGFVAVLAGRFDQLEARDGLQQLTRGIVDVVVAADVTGVVVGDFLFDLGDGLEFVVTDEAGQILGVVDDLVVDAGTAAELAVFVLV